MFSPCQFQVYLSIGTLESDLSQSTPCGTKCSQTAVAKGNLVEATTNLCL